MSLSVLIVFRLKTFEEFVAIFFSKEQTKSFDTQGILKWYAKVLSIFISGCPKKISENRNAFNQLVKHSK